MGITSKLSKTGTNSFAGGVDLESETSPQTPVVVQVRQPVGNQIKIAPSPNGGIAIQLPPNGASTGAAPSYYPIPPSPTLPSFLPNVPAPALLPNPSSRRKEIKRPAPVFEPPDPFKTGNPMPYNAHMVLPPGAIIARIESPLALPTSAAANPPSIPSAAANPPYIVYNPSAATNPSYVPSAAANPTYTVYTPSAAEHPPSTPIAPADPPSIPNIPEDPPSIPSIAAEPPYNGNTAVDPSAPTYPIIPDPMGFSNGR